MEEHEEGNQAPHVKIKLASSWEYYRIISLFSTFCVGLCIFGMICGFVSDSSANKQLWGVLGIIFCISNTLMHFVDRFTRDQLTLLPLYLLNAAQATNPIMLLRLYYFGLLLDCMVLIMTLLLSYFFKFPHPYIATVWFILTTISWFSSNEFKIYFTTVLDNCSSLICSDHHCMFNTSAKKSDIKNALQTCAIVLSNKSEKIVYSNNGQIHYHFIPSQNILPSLDGIKSLTSLYILVFCVWTVSFITSQKWFQNWGFVILFLLTGVQLLRLFLQIWALSLQNTHTTHRSPSLLRVIICVNSIIFCVTFMYGMNSDSNDSDVWNWASKTQYLFSCYGLAALLTVISIVSLIRSAISKKKKDKNTHKKMRENQVKTRTRKHSKKRRGIKNKSRMDINTFLKFAHKRLSEDDRNRYYREQTLSTIDSSELIDPNTGNNTNTNSIDLFTFAFDESESKENNEEDFSIESDESGTESGIESNEEHNIHSLTSNSNSITCSLLSIIIILQCISLSPNLLSKPYKEIMLAITMVNVCALLRITWSHSLLSTLIDGKFNQALQNHLSFPVLFYLSYVLGIVSANMGVIYVILRIYLLHSNDYEKEDYNHISLSLNCEMNEGFSTLIMFALWWPICCLINHENARFIDQFNQRNYPLINSIDGVRPLLPVLFLLLLLSAEIGLIQYDTCLSPLRLLLSCILIFIVAARGILLIISI